MSKIIRQIVSTAKAPKPAGPYSQAVVVNETMYVAGQVGIVPGSSDLVSGGVESEAEQCLKNLQAIVEAGGSDMGKVVKVTVLLDSIGDWPKVNTVYERYFKQPFPARAAYQVGALPKGAKIEIEAVAVIGDVTDDPAPKL